MCQCIVQELTGKEKKTNVEIRRYHMHINIRNSQADVDTFLMS